MNIREYQKKAASTAVYPKKDALPYLALGLANEALEALDEHIELLSGAADARQKFLKELGDIMWYVSELSRLINVPLGNIAYMANNNSDSSGICDNFGDIRGAGSTVASPERESIGKFKHLVYCRPAGKIAGLAKKYLRGDFRKLPVEDISINLADTLKGIAFITRGLNVRMSDVAAANIEKLFSRKSKGTLKSKNGAARA